MTPPLIPVGCHQGYLELPPQRVHVDTPLLLLGSTSRSYESSYRIGPPLKPETGVDVRECKNKNTQKLSFSAIMIELSKAFMVK